jgi:hypothetical protein
MIFGLAFLVFAAAVAAPVSVAAFASSTSYCSSAPDFVPASSSKNFSS